MPHDVNQTPEEVARDRIDDRLRAAGWHVQDRDAIDFSSGSGIAVREYPTDTGPADYVLFCERHAVGVVEAKPDAWGERITTVEEQSERYANAEIKWVSNAEPLPFLYESTGQITRFTNGRDPNPRSREVFTFHRTTRGVALSWRSGGSQSGCAHTRKRGASPYPGAQPSAGDGHHHSGASAQEAPRAQVAAARAPLRKAADGTDAHR